ncbi:rhomboid family intramembrane serine protease [Actinomadura flavalba]|uniref:rhomboid family intramembrane serine protease n=1 Tax=Actinomadura flavalba TaxID=1120938 RepID=UPI0003782572|nr:rhomboid family intramembrane serine protease [Actinomadura flavalba]
MTTDPRHAPETSPPRCYRHPERETYVRCTRCDRHICPDCMHDAAVGHQCPECVAEGNRSVRQPRGTMGGAVARGSFTPVVTYALIGVTVAAYVVSLTSDAFFEALLMWGPGVAHGEWYRLVTPMLLHQRMGDGSFGIAHILFNMWALWVIGPPLEQALGRWRFLALYVLSGIGGSVLLYLVEPGGAAVGASGGIFGLFAAFFVLSRKTGAPAGGIVFLLVINLVITFAVPGISWQGHIGGLAVGGLLAAAFAYAPRSAQRVVGIAAPVAVAALLLAATAVQTVSLTG